MGILLGLAASALIGCSDFLARFSARRTNSLSTTTVALAAGVVTTLVAAPFLGGDPTATDLVLGGLSGVFVGAALALLYHGLLFASTSLVSPIVAFGTAALPVGWAMARGERPSPLILVGVVVAMVGVAVITASPDLGQRVGLGVTYALASAAALGTAFVLVGETGDDAGVWAAVGQRVSGVLTVGSLAAVRSLPLRVPTALLPYAVASGVVGSLGIVSFIAGTQRGDLSSVAVAASLYPAVTAVLAARFDDDTLRWWQFLGVAIVLGGVAAIAAG